MNLFGKRASLALTVVGNKEGSKTEFDVRITNTASTLIDLDGAGLVVGYTSIFRRGCPQIAAMAHVHVYEPFEDTPSMGVLDPDEFCRAVICEEDFCAVRDQVKSLPPRQKYFLLVRHSAEEKNYWIQLPCR